MDQFPDIAYYSPSLQGSLSMAALQRECGGVFVSNRPSTLQRFRNLYPDIPTKRRYRHLNWMGGHKVLDNAKIIVTGAGYEEYLPQFSAKKCMLFHGTLCCLSEGLIKRLTYFDHLFLIGKRMEDQLLRYNDTYDFNYTVTGFIPFALFPDKNEKTRDGILRKLGLNPDKKTIIYTPSKARVGTWLHCAEDIARETPMDFNLVMRPHPNQALNGSRADKASFKRVLKILKDRPNSIVDLTICSLPELECAADLMITDANSPAEESLFYDCPQLLCDTNGVSKEALGELFLSRKMSPDDTEKYLQIFKCGPSFFSDGFKNWTQAIRDAMDQEKCYASSRNEYFRWVFAYGDRNAAKRVSRELLEKIMTKN